MDHSNRTLEEELAHLAQEIKEKEALPIREIITILSGKGRALILIFLTLPFAQPIPLPGLSIPFGIVIAFIGVRMAFGKKIWLPRFLLKKEISSTSLKKMNQRTEWIIKKTKSWIHPRLLWLSEQPTMQIINGLSIAMLGIMLAAPLPIPFTNLPIGWALIFMSLGLLKNDGLFIIAGYILFILSIELFFLLFQSVQIMIQKYL